MGDGDSNPGTEVEVAVLHERVRNLCGKVDSVLRKFDEHGKVTKELNDRTIRLESEVKSLGEEVDFFNGDLEAIKTIEGKSEKGIEVKFLYEVIRLSSVVILILLGEYVKNGM
ncbi:hypothetical protein KAR91_61665 [Candidatus Pacearchaeota archaeon]|nr:hypothetical protein [Candidatus Pacearchaeota archaeon]